MLQPAVRAWLKPMLEILAGVPTVVYGYFAALTVAPVVRDFGLSLGFSVHRKARSPPASSWAS